MTAQRCPRCSEPGFVWSLDEEVTRLTQWRCAICGYSALEDEALESLCAVCDSAASIVLRDESSTFRHCFTCGTRAQDRSAAAKLLLSCHFFGKAFSPALAERRTGISFSSRNEPGEPGVTGRYMGRPRPYGAATLKVDDELPWHAKLDKMLEFLAAHMATIRECGADDIRLDHAYFHDGQCNHEFEAAELKRIADLGITFCLSCYGPEKPRLAGSGSRDH